jgi:hypothetical protein
MDDITFKTDLCEIVLPIGPPGRHMTVLEWPDWRVLCDYEGLIKGGAMKTPMPLTGPVPAGCRWKVTFDRVMIDASGTVQEACGYARTREEAARTAEGMKKFFPAVTFAVLPVADPEDEAALKRALGLTRGRKVEVTLSEEEEAVSGLPRVFLATFDRVREEAAGGWVVLATTRGAVKVRPSRVTAASSPPDLSVALSPRTAVTSCPGCGGRDPGNCPDCRARNAEPLEGVRWRGMKPSPPGTPSS